MHKFWIVRPSSFWSTINFLESIKKILRNRQISKSDFSKTWVFSVVFTEKSGSAGRRKSKQKQNNFEVRILEVQISSILTTKKLLKRSLTRFVAKKLWNCRRSSSLLLNLIREPCWIGKDRQLWFFSKMKLFVNFMRCLDKIFVWTKLKLWKTLLTLLMSNLVSQSHGFWCRPNSSSLIFGKEIQFDLWKWL